MASRGPGSFMSLWAHGYEASGQGEPASPGMGSSEQTSFRGWGLKQVTRVLWLVTQCPTEGFVAELPLSMPRLGLSGHIPDPTKTPFNPLPCVLEEKAGD